MATTYEVGLKTDKRRSLCIKLAVKMHSFAISCNNFLDLLSTRHTSISAPSKHPAHLHQRALKAALALHHFLLQCSHAGGI